MKKLSQIKRGLRRGDHKLIAEITRFTPDYVKMVLAGTRKNQRIVDVAAQVIDSRKKLVAKLQVEQAELDQE